LAAAIGSGGIAAAPAAAKVDMAGLLKQEYAGMREALCPDPDRPPVDIDAMADYEAHKTPPQQVFDNLYYIGMDNIGAWALTTSEGIILLDAMMMNNYEQTVVDGLKTLGLDPADIEYIVISHAHNDHFGGAAFLQKRYGAKVVMAEADWEHIKVWPQMGPDAPLPEKDIAITDGDTLTLGDTTIRFVVTPGHTPGTLSPLVPLKDGDERHLAAYWGGASIGFLEPDGLRQYIASTERFADIDSETDVELSNHPWADGTMLKLDALDARQPGEPHPFVTGHDGVKKWLSVMRGCAEALLEDKLAAE